MFRNLKFLVDAVRAFRASGPRSGASHDPRMRGVGDAMNAWKAVRAGRHGTAARFAFDAVKALRASRSGHVRGGTSSQVKAIVEAVRAYRAARKPGRF